MNQILPSLGLILQIGRFGIVGALATVVHVTTAYFFHYVIGFAPLNANVIAFLVAWVVAYLGHFSWTFEGRSSHGISVQRFAMVSLMALMLNQLIVWLVNERLGQPFYAALIAVVLVVPLTSFAASKFWTFRDRRQIRHEI